MPDASSAVLMSTAGALPLIGAAASRLSRNRRRRLQPVPGIAAVSQVGVAERVKRALDFVAAALLIVLFAPIMLAVALIVWSKAKRSPIFYRRRVLAGRQPPQPEISLAQFDAFKFRTMSPDAESALWASPELLDEYLVRFKLDDDPRVTPEGRILRALGLDELPQLLNVLRGEMSLVGPRIITQAELVKYGENAARLLSVRPGITGWWQVNGWNHVSYAERVALDMWYIENRTLWLDFMILCRTPHRIHVEWRRLRAQHRT